VGIPAESPVAGDDGYVMAYVHDPERSAADLVILSAQDFRGELVPCIHLPVRVPLGLRGNWVPKGCPVGSASPAECLLDASHR
jgi:carotenoid cleavage dioxygenase